MYNNLQYDKIGDLQTVSVRSHFRAHTSAGVCLQSGEAARVRKCGCAKLLLNSHTRTRAATHIWCAIASKIPAHKQFGDLCSTKVLKSKNVKKCLSYVLIPGESNFDERNAQMIRVSFLKK